jgi:hypothetical protein
MLLKLPQPRVFEFVNGTLCVFFDGIYIDATNLQEVIKKISMSNATYNHDGSLHYVEQERNISNAVRDGILAHDTDGSLIWGDKYPLK